MSHVKYTALRSLHRQAKDGKAVINDLHYVDRQAWGVIEALRPYRQFDLWWEDLDDVHQNVAFENIKKAIKAG